jgi:uncharacterized HAD superfamily protein
MKIGIDFDDVLAPSIIGFRKYFNNKHNKVHEKIYWDELDTLGLSFEEFIKEWNEFCVTDYHNNMIPISDSIDVLKRLSKEHELYLISARSTKLEKTTRKLIDNYFPNIFKEIHLINKKEEINNKKSEVCLEQKIDIMIDDSLSNLIDCEKVGTKGIWFTQYLTARRNEFINPKIIIARSWLDVERQIEKEKKEKSNITLQD